MRSSASRVILALRRLIGNTATAELIGSAAGAGGSAEAAARTRSVADGDSCRRRERPLTTSRAARATLLSTPRLPLQRLPWVNDPDLDTTGDSTITTDCNGRPQRVDATNLKMVVPGSIASGTNKPRHYPPGWRFLRENGLTQRPPHHRRMHVVSGISEGRASIRTSLDAEEERPSLDTQPKWKGL